MRGALAALILLTATHAAAQTPGETPPAIRAALGEAVGTVLQADSRRARTLLADVPEASLDERLAAFRACVLERLDPERPLPPVADEAPFPLKALDAYRRYWREATDEPEARTAAEEALAVRLGALLGRPELRTMLEAEAPTLERIEAEGWHALGGRTGRLMELMLWRDQDQRDVQVELPEGPRQARLILLDGFESRGWSNWLTCGRASTGGWANPEGLYAIVPAYDSLEDETFRVNFLAHETQHFADYERFPGLEGWELEIRAKLTELALAEETRPAVLARLAGNQGDDPADAHSYANRHVLTALRRRLGLEASGDLAAVPVAVLQAAAEAELRADTARRQAARPQDPS